MGDNLRLRILKGLAFLLFTATNANAGGLSIWPLQVNLLGDGAIQELNVTNPTDEASYVQVTAVEWHEPGEADQAGRIDSILAVPPIFELPPNSSQLVRIASRGPIRDGIEHTYRLVITEVPRTAGLVPNSLAIAARMTLPIFVTPEGATPVPVWSIAGKETAKPHLVLTNQGTASIKVRKVEIVNAKEDKAAFSINQSSLVLAGGKKRWPLDLAGLKEPITVRAETTAGPLEAQISLPGG